MRSCCAFYFCDHLLMTCFIFSACSIHAVEVYRNLGETTRGAYSACLTIWVTHDPSTGVRATTSLRGERAQQAAYSLPSQRFSLALSFPQPSPLLWRTDGLNHSHDFSRQISFLSVLCSIMGMCSFTSSPIGGWGRRKAGDWGRKPGRGRGIAAGLPPFPRVVSPR